MTTSSRRSVRVILAATALALVGILACTSLGSAFTVTAVLRLGEDLESHDEIWLAGAGAEPDQHKAMFLRLVKEGSGWFSIWNLQIASDANLLPAEFIDGTEDGLQYITLASMIVPAPGDEYQVIFSYEPQTGETSVVVRDVEDSGREDAARFVANPSHKPLSPVFGWPGSGAPSAKALSVVSVEVEDVYRRHGLPLALQREFGWELGHAEQGVFAAAAGNEFYEHLPMAVLLRWPSTPVSGKVRLSLEREGRTSLLQEAGWSPSDGVLPLADIPLGESTIAMEWTESGESIALASVPVRRVAGSVEVEYRVDGRNEKGELSGQIALRPAFEKPLTGARVQLLAEYQAKEPKVNMVVFDGVVDEIPARGIEIPLSVAVPPYAGTVQFSAASERLGIVPKGSESVAVPQVAPVSVSLDHPSLVQSIGVPAIVPYGEGYPTLETFALVEAVLEGCIKRNGQVVVDIPVQTLTPKQTESIGFAGVPEPGLYQIELSITEQAGVFHDAFYFTVDGPEALPPNASKIVFEGADGRLVYVPDYRGNRIPDFSHAGYMGGGVAIPEVPVKVVLEPGPNRADDRERIQAAIDSVAALPRDEDGLHGAVLLKKGTYRVSDTIYIRSSGVILRGEGQGKDGTIIIATARKQHDVIRLTGAGSLKEEPGTRRRVMDNYVPVGARTIRVEDASGYKVGDDIVVFRPSTAEWIRDLGMDGPGMQRSGITPWKPGSYDFRFERKITHISGNEITIDVPLVQAMESKYGGGYVYRSSFPGRISQVGVENLRVVSEYDRSKGTSDEDHAWNAVVLDYVVDGWVRRVTGLHLGYSVVTVGGNAKRVTVEDSEYLDGVSLVTGGRRYSFNVNGQQVLVQRGFARSGRHDFANGSRVRGPNVFLASQAEDARSVSEPHHRWSMGTLYDNVSTEGQIVGLQAVNRGTSGTGHGWAGAQIVFWNCRSQLIPVGKPPTAQNYAIGLRPIPPRDPAAMQGALRWIIAQGQPFDPAIAGKYVYRGQALVGDAYLESPHGPVTPDSLYLRQLAERLGEEAVSNIGW